MSNIETVKAIYEAFGKGDIPFILSCLDDNVEWDSWTVENSAQKADIPWMKKRIGKDDVAEFFKVTGTMGIFQFDILSFMEGENQVTAEIVVGSKYFTDETLHLWTFNNEGKITRMRHYIDTAKHIAANEKYLAATA